MKRKLSISNLYAIKPELFVFSGIWDDVLGKKLTKTGVWLIWGAEKNGKTSFALILANYLSTISKVLYVSAEEGKDPAFIENMKRMQISHENKTLHVLEYTPIDELEKQLSKQRSEDIVIIDNLTIYQDELSKTRFLNLLQKHGDKLFIFLAHEDRKVPYTAIARHARKLAKAIFYVKGMACMVSGRVPGGTVVVDEAKAKIFHGNDV